MGIEYPILALISCIVFALMVFSFLSLYLHIVEQIDRIPDIDIDLEVYQENFYSLITVIIKHKGGEEITLRYFMINTDKGVIKVDLEDGLNTHEKIIVRLIGFKDNKIILPGSTTRIILKIPSDYFYSKGKYSYIMVFDKTTMSSSFNI